VSTPRRHDLGLALRVAIPVLVALITVTVLRPSTQTGNATSLGVSSAKLLLMTAGPPGDVVAPQLTTLEMFDDDVDGKVDRVLATFNETLATPYSAATTGWTLTNVPSGGSLASVAVSGTTATLSLNEGAGAPNTAVGSFTVALAATTNGIRDAANNRSSFAATALTDKASPIPVDVVTTNPGNSAGEIQQGDQLTITFSEAIATASIPASPVTVTENSTGGQQSDTISIPGVTDGALLLGGASYVTGNQTATAPANVANIGSTVVVTLTGCNCSKAKPGQGAFAYTPATTLADAAGNTATGSFTTVATFRMF
jgi:hypothetical protein